MNSTFWPKRKQHVLRAFKLGTPENFSPALNASIKQLARLANVIRELERAGEKDSMLVQTLLVCITNHLATASGQLADDASRQALELIADGLMGSVWVKDTGAQLTALDEQELVSYVGPLATWLGKSRGTAFSAFFGTPNPVLQAVSDQIDRHHALNVAGLSRQLGVAFKQLPVCSYKIVDLIAIGGEADTYPKHFAYFMPEDQGIKYSPVKRTIVFANTYLGLYQQISLEQRGIFGWTDHDLPAVRDVERYMMSWFRGHDLGHSIVLPSTDYRSLSRHDRWGSMIAQEAVADVFGFLLALAPQVADSLELDPGKMVRFYVLELFRYLRRGPTEFPDAGAAYAQLKMLEHAGVLTVNGPGSIRIDCEAFPSAMADIARTLIDAVMCGDLEAFDSFLRNYGVHRAEGTDLLFGLPMCDVSLLYEQPLLESE